MFAKMQGRLQRWLIESLIPENIARQVLGYLNQFASKASGLGIASLIVLLITAIALILTIDKTLNNIWRVRSPRPFAQRVLIYWAAITLGPLILAVSLSTTSYVFAASRDVVGVSVVKLFFDAFEFVLLAAGMASSTTTCPTPTCAGRMPGPAACSWRRPSRSPSGCWATT